MTVEGFDLDAGLGLFGFKVDHTNAVLTVAASDIHGAGKAVVGIDEDFLALDELDLLLRLPGEYGRGVGLQILGDFDAFVMLLNGVVDTTAQIGGLLDLLKRFVDKPIDIVVVGFLGAAFEAQGGKRDLLQLPTIELRLGEDA